MKKNFFVLKNLCLFRASCFVRRASLVKINEARNSKDTGFCIATNLVIVLFTIFQLTSFYAAAEIIDVHNEEKSFGEWKVFCEIDDMMSLAHCKVAAKFFDNSSVITIQPSAKYANQFFIIIPQIQIGNFVKLRVDQNDLILSKNISNKDFGMVPLDDAQKNALFLQMKNGDFLYLRFSVRGSEKEVTIKLNLKDFRNALSYYNSRASK